MNSLETIEREFILHKLFKNIYYTEYVINSDYDCDTINPLYLVINRLIGYIEKIEGSSDKYLVVADSVRNKYIINVISTRWDLLKIKLKI